MAQPVSNAAEAEATLAQLSKVVSEFMIKYPSHTQRIPSVRPGEHALIAFVRQMAASMANKQEELEILNEEVTEAAREKERFLANMSHEVRTPMNGIFGMVNLLLEMDLDPVQREYLDTIHASSESLLNILDDILDYAKLNANQMPLKPRAFDLSKLIRDVLLVYKPTADSKEIELSATICEALPDTFVADDLRLKQVISNLVSNAIKFTDSGEVSLTVRGIQKSGRKQLFFEIRDSGIGITAEAGKTLFSPSDSSTRTMSDATTGPASGSPSRKISLSSWGAASGLKAKAESGQRFSLPWITSYRKSMSRRNPTLSPGENWRNTRPVR